MIKGSRLYDLFYALRCHLLLRLWARGLYTPPDRKLLERVFIPNLANDPSYERVLFVGTATYCNYEDAFKEKEFATMDPDPAAAAGGAARHFVDRLANLGLYYPRDHFDLIILNGVLGWGLNEASEIEASVQVCFSHLRSGGRMLVGLNEKGAPAPVCLAEIDALRSFNPVNLPGMSVPRLDFDHPFDRDFTYAMFERPA